jgi:hypothetical protein
MTLPIDPIKRREKLDREKVQKLWRRYGLTPETHRELVEKQQGCCALCGRKKSILDIDHCHETRRVRGLLCLPCNTSLGRMIGDSTNSHKFARLLSYLQPQFNLLDWWLE